MMQYPIAEKQAKFKPLMLQVWIFQIPYWATAKQGVRWRLLQPVHFLSDGPARQLQQTWQTNPHRSAISDPSRYTKSLYPRTVGVAGLISRLDRGNGLTLVHQYFWRCLETNGGNWVARTDVLAPHTRQRLRSGPRSRITASASTG